MQAVRAPSSQSPGDISGELIAKPTEFGEMLPATGGVAVWLFVLIGQGVTAALETSWLLMIALPLGAWALLMRLRFGGGRLARTVGPWRCSVDLGALESITWKMTGGGRSRGMMFVRD